MLLVFYFLDLWFKIQRVGVGFLGHCFWAIIFFSSRSAWGWLRNKYNNIFLNRALPPAGSMGLRRGPTRPTRVQFSEWLLCCPATCPPLRVTAEEHYLQWSGIFRQRRVQEEICFKKYPWGNTFWRAEHFSDLANRDALVRIPGRPVPGQFVWMRWRFLVGGWVGARKKKLVVLWKWEGVLGQREGTSYVPRQLKQAQERLPPQKIFGDNKILLGTG